MRGIAGTDLLPEAAPIFPTDPVIGQLFLHTPTGRSILYEYDGSDWIPLEALGDLTVYVDPINGTDDLEHGYGTLTSAFATILYAIAIRPKQSFGLLNINLANGTYTETLRYYPSGGGITIQADMTVLTSLVATGGITGGGNNTARVDGTFLANQYNKKIIHFTSGANDGLYKVIGLTTVGSLYLIGEPLAAAPAGPDTYDILDWVSTIDGEAGIWGSGYTRTKRDTSLQDYGYVQVRYIGIKFICGYNPTNSSQVQSNQGQYTLVRCWVLNSDASLSVVSDNGSDVACVQTVIEVTNPAVTSGAYAVLRSQIDIMESKIEGGGVAGSTGLNLGSRGMACFQSSEIDGFSYGIRAYELGFAHCASGGVKNFIHGCASYGVSAEAHSHITYVSYNRYGVDLDGSADANGADENAEAANFSWVGL